MNQVKSNGANNTLFQHDRPNKPNRSKFDLSRVVNISGDAGMIIPFDCFPTLPDDQFYISQDCAIDTLPLVQASLTNYKITFHWYYMKARDAWKGFKTFITKGRSGNIELFIPRVDLTIPYSKSLDFGDGSLTSVKIVPVSHHSLSSFLGVPPDISGWYQTDGTDWTILSDYLPYSLLNISDNTGLKLYGKPNALPFMMYQSIVKNNYVNQNLLQGNTALFPEEGDDDFLIPYTVGDNGDGIINFLKSNSKSLPVGGKVNYTGVYSNDETDVDLRLLRYAMFDDDYFTTALPWLQRGNVRTMPLSGNAVFSDVPVSLDYQGTGDAGFITGNVYVNTDSDNDKQAYPIFTVNPDGSSSISSGYNNYGSVQTGQLQAYLSAYQIANNLTVNTSHLNGTNTVNLSITANQLRELLAYSVWQERNARVDGSYNKMIYQHWAQNPNSEEHLPQYIGGTACYMNFSTIVQNSQTTKDSALGSTAGYGSASGSSDICSFHCPDYGYIMGIMIIRPNTFYQQGVERFLSCENTFSDFVQPEFEGLSPQPILNKELYVSSNPSDNEDMFAYQERNTTYKVRQNVNRGLFQVSPEKDILFSAFTQARWFSSKPVFSYQFCVMSPDNIRRDWLAYPKYPAFRAQIASKVIAVRSLSYSSQPNTFGF